MASWPKSLKAPPGVRRWMACSVWATANPWRNCSSCPSISTESLRRGLGQAASALVIGDGAVWLWRLADDRFPQARQRLDFYHAVQHLAVVGRVPLWGRQGDVQGLVQQLKTNRPSKSSASSKKPWQDSKTNPPSQRSRAKSITFTNMRRAWTTGPAPTAANPSAAVLPKQPADSINAASNAPASSGVRKAMKP